MYNTVCTSVFEKGLIMEPRLISDLESCCPSLLSAGNTRVPTYVSCLYIFNKPSY